MSLIKASETVIAKVSRSIGGINGETIEIKKGDEWICLEVGNVRLGENYFILHRNSDGSRTQLDEHAVLYLFQMGKRLKNSKPKFEMFRAMPYNGRRQVDVPYVDFKTENDAKLYLKRHSSKGQINARLNGRWQIYLNFDVLFGFTRNKD